MMQERRRVEAQEPGQALALERGLELARGHERALVPVLAPEQLGYAQALALARAPKQQGHAPALARARELAPKL